MSGVPTHLPVVGVVAGVALLYFFRNLLLSSPSTESNNENDEERRKKMLEAAQARYQANHKKNTYEVPLNENINLNDPPRYKPETTIKEEDMLLYTHQETWIIDNDLKWHIGKALLDTGNLGITLISESFARHLGLTHSPGQDPSVFQTWLGTTEISGVVPGAKHDVPLISITYRIKEKVFKNRTVGVCSSDNNWDLLVSNNDLRELQSDGYQLKL
eukprot:NODE_6532_length_874_cov_40.496671_g5937_i0.p1 GENE.NODE_6532_length_874_cov_40.496671_g5937_i0~~NODE_6532_length_874_cov_40.496671_g5937_i0.p1  ORF type:complete len:216 (+),score=32.81 NODE_6532_length_874_cov_40.496671_g5937_i0:84-731(+)